MGALEQHSFRLVVKCFKEDCHGMQLHLASLSLDSKKIQIQTNF